ncbi:hypothetical protein [Kribbella sp. NPDC051620]|uniref:hypothetical protein n=1 Tax=Kribbella sp. NPDC051620 TaxID=3364120 RepID=UPI003795DFAB
MASIEEDMLRDVYQVFRKIAAKHLRKRSPSMSQRMQQARARQQAQLLEALREQEYRSLVEDMQNERRHNPEYASALDGLSDAERTQRVEAEARWQQDQRDRMDNDPNLTPDDIQREVDRDLDGNGLDDPEDRRREAEDFERNVVDRDGNGEVDAVEQRQAQQEARDAEARRQQEQERATEQRESEEARGGDVVPAAAAAGATAVAADEILDEVEERRVEEQQSEDQQVEDQEQDQLLDGDGAAPEVIGETEAEAADRQQATDSQEQSTDSQYVDQDGAAPEVIGETEAERSDRLAEPEASQDDRLLDEDGAAPAVIGEDAQQAQQEQDDRLLDEDGAAPAVIGEDAQQVQQEQDDRLLDEDGAAPAVIGEDAQQVQQEQDGLDQERAERDGLEQDGTEPGAVEQDRTAPGGVEQDGGERERREEQVQPGEAGPQPGLKTGGDQAAAADQEAQNEQRGPDYVETTLEQARSENGPNGQGEQNGQRPGMSQDEMDKLRGLQGGQAEAAAATRPRTGEPVEVGAGGKNPGARAAELRADKGSRRDGPGVGE